MIDFIIATLVIIVVGSMLLAGILVVVIEVRHKKKRDYGEDLDYGDDIYGPSLMDVGREE